MSIAEAITNAQTRVNAVYDKCEEKGATLPETKNLANLPATIDTIPAGGGGDVVKAYVSGVNLWTPATGVHGWQMTYVSDIDVLLTRVGYQATGSDTLSPNIRVSFLTEQGYVGKIDNQYPIYYDKITTQFYNMINGSVDDSSGFTNTLVSTSSNTFLGFSRILPFFLHNGSVFLENAGSSYDYYRASSTFVFYTYGKIGRPFDTGLFYGVETLTVCETGIFNSWKKTFYTVDTNLNPTTYSVKYNPFIQGCMYFIEDDLCWYSYYATSSNLLTWKLFRHDKVNDTAANNIATITFGTAPVVFDNNDGLVLQHKTKVKTETGYLIYQLSRLWYTCIEINEEDETQSTLKFCDWSAISDVIGNRTIYKIQTFYDGAFSLDLNEGTTLMCRFTEDRVPEVFEIVEPFIIEGDDTIYHRTFTENRLFWYQRPEGRDNLQTIVANAPISSNPYGPYNATKATVDWLAVPRELSRWNTTVLTGVIRMGAQTAKPEFDDTNRRVIDVETTIKESGGLLVHNGDWTLDDLNKVNGII